jgi:nitrite reductase (NADH) large subunit
VLKDGREIPADVVVCAIGVRPNADLARAAGLDVNRGILVGDGLETSDPSIFALGECVEHRGVAYGLVEPAYEQARILARRLAGDAEAAYPGSVLATNLKVSGVSVFSAGDFLGQDKDTIIFKDEGCGVYKKLVVDGGHLTGAVLYGDTADGLWYLDLMRKKAEVSGMRRDLIFGPQPKV